VSLTLGSHTFELKPDPPKGGRVMVLTKRLSSGSASDQMGAYYDFIASLVVNADGLDEALCDMELEDIQTQVAEAMKAYTDLPTVRPSPSPAGPPPTATTSKVVSLSRGTVKTVDVSQTA
jgi:hypothetical protein